GSLLDALAAEQLSELDLEEAARLLAQMHLSPLTDALVKGRAAELARLLRQATLSLDFRGLQSPLQRGFYARRLLQAAGGTRADRRKARLTRKRKVRRRGVRSVRRTLRKNLETGGFPARLVFRSKRPERPEILVLCDVSDSVRNVSRLMLQFVYTLQELYSRVRSFVFVSEIGEVTDLFKKMDVSAAVDLATA